MNSIKKTVYVVLLLLAVPLAFNALSYIHFNTTYGFLRLKKQAIETGWYLPAYYTHVLLAAFILLTGFFQLLPVNGGRRRWHRLLGKLYVGGVLFFSAPGALIMSFFIQRGPWVLSSFVLQCSLWFAFTWLAYKRIREGNREEHKKWMLRSFSLTLAAITLRIYVFIGSWSFDLSQPMAYATIAWLSWGLNLMMCEWYLFSEEKRRKLIL